MRNRGELAEGWYDPTTLQKAQASAAVDDVAEPRRPRGSPDYGSPKRGYSSEEDFVGPALPGQEGTDSRAGKRSGPAIPNMQDLEMQRGMVTATYSGHFV